MSSPDPPRGRGPTLTRDKHEADRDRYRRRRADPGPRAGPQRLLQQHVRPAPAPSPPRPPKRPSPPNSRPVCRRLWTRSARSSTPPESRLASDRRRQVDRIVRSGEGRHRSAHHPADHTRIGSITKTMTATVIPQLIDEGKLSFDDVLDKYVPGMPNGETLPRSRTCSRCRPGSPLHRRHTKVLNQYAADPTTTFHPPGVGRLRQETTGDVRPGASSSTPTPLRPARHGDREGDGTSIADNFSERLFTPPACRTPASQGPPPPSPSPTCPGSVSRRTPWARSRTPPTGIPRSPRPPAR